MSATNCSNDLNASSCGFPHTNFVLLLNFSDGLSASVVIWRFGTNLGRWFSTPKNDLNFFSV